MIVYVSGTLQLHGLELRTEAELEELRRRVERVLLDEIKPLMTGDVSFEIEEHAGTFEDQAA